MYGYIYLTTNLINGKKYIGQHKASKISESYKGSGKLIRSAFKKYGKSNFSTVILRECSSIEEMNESERFYIKLYDAVNSEDFYNILPGGQSTKEVDSRVRDNLIKNGDKTKGSVWMHKNDVYKRVQKEQVDAYIQDGFEFGGPKRGSLARERYSASKKDLVIMTNDSTTVYVKSSDVSNYLDRGFHIGRIPSIKKGSFPNLIYVNNGVEERRISPRQLDEFESMGYKIGRKKFKSFNRVKPAHNKGKHVVKCGDKITYM